MKWTWSKAAAAATLASVTGGALIAAILWTAALAADTDENSIHRLEGENDRWQYLILTTQRDYPEPRSIETLEQILRWQRLINDNRDEIKDLRKKGD